MQLKRTRIEPAWPHKDNDHIAILTMISMSMAEDFVETFDGFVEDLSDVLDGILIYRQRSARRRQRNKASRQRAALRMAMDMQQQQQQQRDMSALLERSLHEEEAGKCLGSRDGAI